MEEIDEGVNGSESKSSGEGLPPNPTASAASAYRQCNRNDSLVLPCKNSLVRHSSLVTFSALSFLYFVFLISQNLVFICIHCGNGVSV